MKQPFLATPTVSPEFMLGGEAAEGTYAPTDFWAGNPDPKVQDFVKKFAGVWPGQRSPHDHGCMYDAPMQPGSSW
jgi:hypothetical protein